MNAAVDPAVSRYARALAKSREGRAIERKHVLALLKARGPLATSQIARALGWSLTKTSRALGRMSSLKRERIVDAVDVHTTWTIWSLQPGAS